MGERNVQIEESRQAGPTAERRYVHYKGATWPEWPKWNPLTCLPRGWALLNQAPSSELGSNQAQRG